MKKLGVIVLLSLFVFGGLADFVSAQLTLQVVADSAENFYNTIFEPFGKFLLGSNTDSGELFFAKLLFFIILISLVNYALSQVSPLQSKSWIISVVVSILAVRWITPTWVETVVLPYTALGIALTSFFPFILYFFYVEKGLAKSTVMRKTAWIFAAVVFVGLFFYRVEAVTIGFYPSGIQEKPINPAFNPAFIYLITAGLCLIMFIADKTIQNALANVRASADSDLRLAKHQLDLDDEYIKATRNQLEPGFDVEKADIVIKSIQKKAKRLGIPPGKYKLVGKA